ncbi:MAG TPA: IS1380 family transposase, partial [Dermatophilaceae bacterium]|nr:IS1380 family transposase [Dermatophilaceae bacterium]
MHDPAKVVLDLATAVALGGDALSDAAIVRGEPGVYGLVAPDAPISRTIARLARDAERVLRSVAVARKAARAVAW